MKSVGDSTWGVIRKEIILGHVEGDDDVMEDFGRLFRGFFSVY